jgi:hypothetical protein
MRIFLLLIAGAVIAAVAAAFGIARDYGYLRASILTGSVGGYYHALATRLAERAARGHGSLTVVPTAGSIENVNRLARGEQACSEKFALIQDGTPVPPEARLELLGRLPEPDSLFLLGRQDNAFHAFADLRGTSIGIGPEGSGTAYLVRQLFEGPDLQELDVHLSSHPGEAIQRASPLPEQRRLAFAHRHVDRRQCSARQAGVADPQPAVPQGAGGSRRFQPVEAHHRRLKAKLTALAA